MELAGNRGYAPYYNHRGSYGGYGRYRYPRYGDQHRYSYPRYDGDRNYREDSDLPVPRYYGGYGYRSLALGFGGYGYGGYFNQRGIAQAYRDGTIGDSGESHVRWCSDKYRSYNPRTDMFLGYDGKYHRCRGPY